MNAEKTEGDDMRPVRRTEKLVVREVGDELVAYALDTEQVTAIDPVTAQVWQRLDGSADLAEIAADSGLALAEVETAVSRLDDAGLVASGLDRRRFMRLAAAGAGAGALLTIAAPSAQAAGSLANVTISNTSCSGNKKNYSLTVNGTGFIPGTISVTVNLTFTTPASTGTRTRNNITVAPNGSFTANFTGANDISMSTALASSGGTASVNTSGAQTYSKTGIPVGGC